MHALGVQRVTCDDVDGAQKGACAVSGRVGATQDFDALNVFNRHRLQTGAGAALQVQRVNRAAIHHDLDVVGEVAPIAVVAALRRVTLKRVADPKTRHQPQQVGHVTRTAHADGAPIQNGDGPRCFIQALRQSGHRQDDGHVAQKILLRNRLRLLRQGKPGP